MTEQQQAVARITWPLVVLAAIAAAFFIGVFAIIPQNMPEARTGLLGFLTLSASGVITVVVQRLGNKVETINRQTNGTMSALIAAKTQPQTVVSRETLPAAAPVKPKVTTRATPTTPARKAAKKAPGKAAK